MLFVCIAVEPRASNQYQGLTVLGIIKTCNKKMVLSKDLTIQNIGVEKENAFACSKVISLITYSEHWCIVKKP